eukprot:GHUV01004852.1.p1 GENE.GHUV01004852.1~~GHUV01004852.1.p1  ORF type:complete len:557 (+),score=249.71 GHUV01004852.1:74-1744(+)
MLGSRTPTCLVQGKTSVNVPALVSGNASRRVTRRRAQAFKGSRRALVTVAAAESDAAPAPAARAPKAPLRALSTLEPNEVVEGRVASITAFGAFVDIGAESQGLIHVSQLADGFVKNINDVIKVGEVVKVRVLNVDVANKRFALTRKGLGAPRAAPSARGRQQEVDEAEEDGEVAADPNVAELDGVTFVVEDEDETADVDAAELEFVDELPEDVALDIAIAAEDIVHGTVVRVEKAGVTVSYKLEDGTDVEGLIHVSELLAPSHLVAGDVEEEEGEQYTEVADIDPAAYYKVGDSISCFVFDVEDGQPMLTQRLPDEADDDFAAVAELLEETEPESVPDALLIEGMWAAAEDPAEGDDEAENGDELLEALDPEEGVVAAAGDEEMPVVLTADIQQTVFDIRRSGATRSDKALPALATLSLPDRPVGADPSSSAAGAIFDKFAEADSEDEAEFIGVSTIDTSYLPAALLRKMGYKMAKPEEGGEWEVQLREGADEAEVDEQTYEQLEGIAVGGYDPRAVDAIVRDLMADDDDFDEAELPRLARRNPVVAAAAVSGRK